MTEKMTCEEFNSRLTEFVLGKMNEDDAALMDAHLSYCAECCGIADFKKALALERGGPEQEAPADIERGLIDAVMSDIGAAREARRSARSWASRFLMPAMAAAIIIFVFLTGFMLSEIRNLHRETGELREEVAVMETVLAGSATRGERPVFGRLTGNLRSAPGGMTVGEAARFLETLPPDTPVLSEDEAKSLIAENRRLRRLAGYLKENPWEGGLTSGELLLVIIALDVDPDTRIPDEWRAAKEKI